jgi:hypothetical protein
MKDKDYQYITVEIISMIKDKATYLKNMEKGANFNSERFEGMLLTYHHILDSRKNYLECHDEVSLEEFGMSEYDPSEILDYKPLETS